MKRIIFLLLIPCVLISFVTPSGAAERKKKKQEEKVEETKKQTKYDKLFENKKVKSARGEFISIHQIGDKLYLELPLEYLERDMLLGSAISGTSETMVGVVGERPAAPIHFNFLLKDSSVYFNLINTSVTSNPSETELHESVARNNMSVLLKPFKVEAFNNDSTAIVFDVTSFLGKHNDLIPTVSESLGGGFLTISASPNSECSGLEDFKVFGDNIMIKTRLSYKLDIRFFSMTLLSGEPVTLEATRSILLLPQEKMKPRISDSRVGIFLTGKTYVTTEEDKILRYSLAHRWRVEPSDEEAYKRGELVAPKKPIVFYVDTAFPRLWREPVKKGAERWNAAFEKIGFKNVIQVREFPKNDPSFDPENLKYNCIRYVPTSTQNAMGPSWVDPTTGEIVCASVLVYNNVIQLINNWRFVQTAQVDPSVRGKKLPDNIIEESIEYIVAHEVGHCLGFMHNMSASAAYPVDSLRSASFTQKNGTTPSIMDYARFNYVAQLGDEGVRLTPPCLGVYDDFLVKWNYQPVLGVGDIQDELKITESWIDEKVGDPRYRYGCQQIYSRYDPSAIEEDLGDDPIKASSYGIKNLKYVFSNLNKWVEDDEDFSHRSRLYEQIVQQYARYVSNVVNNIGGIYLTRVKEGTIGKSHVPVPRDIQKRSLAWVIQELKTCDWLSNDTMKEKLPLHTDMVSLVRMSIMEQLLKSYEKIILSSHLDKDPYTLNEYFNDMYNLVFDKTIKSRKLTPADRVLQKSLLVASVKSVKGEMKISAFALGEKTALPSLSELIVYDLLDKRLKPEHIAMLKKTEEENGSGYVASKMRLNDFGTSYEWQGNVSLQGMDHSQDYYNEMLVKIERLLKGRLNTADTYSRMHYQTLLFEIEKIRKQ